MTSFALVGLGLIGRERLRALEALAELGRPVEVIGVLDPAADAESVSGGRFEPRLCASLSDLVALRPDWVVVATPHDIAVEHALRLLDSEATVLLEKPLGRTVAESERLLEARRRPDQLWVGHNYRFFEGIAALLDDAARGRFGRLLSASLTIGHGGAPGMERGWKLDPLRAGGGALIDPGVHLLDLVLLAGGATTVRGGLSGTGFWNTGIEEECHLLLESERIPIVSLQVSIVRWRSTFRIELNGEDGYGVVEGRGRSYGPQTYRRGRRWGWRDAASQAESEEHVVHSDGDDVFVRELDALLDGASRDRACRADDALEVMRLLEACREALGLTAARTAAR